MVEETIQEEKTEATNIIDIKNLSGGLEILVQLAEQGDIDPWDVDIIDVTNKYLAALDSSPRENLLNAGRAIFYASVLLRMKSEILLNFASETLSESQESENLFPEDELLNEEVKIDLSKLETFINRSSLAKNQRKRKIILSDLIMALQQAEEEDERRALRARIRQERRANLIIAPEIPDDVLEMAHEEDVEDIVERIESIIQEHLTDEKPISFSYLAEILNDKVKPFLALLFMAHRGSLVIEQENMYGEIYIYKPGRVTKDMIEQQEEIKRVQEEEKEKKKKGFGRKVKDKIQSEIKKTAKKIKDKITEVINSGSDEKETSTKEPQTLIMADESIKEIKQNDEEGANHG